MIHAEIFQFENFLSHCEFLSQIVFDSILSEIIPGTNTIAFAGTDAPVQWSTGEAVCAEWGASPLLSQIIIDSIEKYNYLVEYSVKPKAPPLTMKAQNTQTGHLYNIKTKEIQPPLPSGESQFFHVKISIFFRFQQNYSIFT